jgi:hypothetical protein
MSQWYKLNITDSGPIGVGAFDGPTGQAPSVNGAVISSNNIFFQSASTSYPGMVNTTSQSFAGKKTFVNQIAIQGDTSGTVTINSSTGTYNFTLPTTVGPTGQFLTSNGGGPMYWSEGTTGPTGANSAVTGPTGASITGPTGASSTVTGPTGVTGATSTVTGPTGADSTVTGPTGADSTVTGPTGATSTVTGPTGSYGPLGNVLRVDSVYGNDSTASISGLPYLTVNAAVSAAVSGSTIWILPGTYTLTSGITVPPGVSLRGLSLQTCTIQMTGVTSNTTLLTMGENTRVEDLTLNLTSSGHYTLKGIVFGGTTSTTAKLRTCVLTVNNSTASDIGTSNVYGVECSGTGGLNSASFSFNCLKGSTINVKSNGNGDKRGILISNSNVVTTRDLNVYVAAPPGPTGFTGSYVGVVTNDTGGTGSIQMRSTTVGTVKPTGTQGYINSDILQSTPSIVSDPTYLASPGIQIGPGTDLVTKSAGGKPFSTYIYPTTLFYCVLGNNNRSGYLWPGTVSASGSYPDQTTPTARYRTQQPLILSGISASLNSAGGGASVVITACKNASTGGSLSNPTVFTITLSSANLNDSFYNGSVDFSSGDFISIFISITGGNVTDLSVQLDCF